MENLKHKHKEGVNVGYRDNQLATIDSREVAEMMNKRHSEILEYINGSNKVVGIIPTLLNGGIRLANYFIESSYKDGSGKTNKCYLVTKMGCELLGNKQQGEKGILFTAKYVERFNEMEEVLRQPQKQLSPMEMMELQFKIIKEHDKRFEEVDEKIESLSNSMTIDYGQQEVIHRIAKERIVVVLGGKDTPAYRELNRKVFSNMWKRYKQVFHVASYKDTAKKDYEEAINYINKWEPSKELGYMITGANSQIQFNN